MDTLSSSQAAVTEIVALTEPCKVSTLAVDNINLRICINIGSGSDCCQLGIIKTTWR